MWGFLIGLYIALIIYPYLQEWRQRRVDKASLAKSVSIIQPAIDGMCGRVNGLTSSRCT